MSLYTWLTTQERILRIAIVSKLLSRAKTGDKVGNTHVQKRHENNLLTIDGLSCRF
jgi:hypothetical protein